MQHPPYYLRINKSVDRLLLVEVLRPLQPDHRFTYYSLAGPFLEDLRVMDHFFPEMRLVSFEGSKHTHARQQFHQFNSRIELHHQRLEQFFSKKYQPGYRDVFWLDYTDFGYHHFQQFQAIIKAVPLGSVVRITLRAEPEIDLDYIRPYVGEERLAQIRAEIEKAFETTYAQVLPPQYAGVFAGRTEYAQMVSLMVKQAASQILDKSGSDRDFLLVQASRYDDSTQMVSITGIIYPRDELEETKAKFVNNPFVNFDWNNLLEINVPNLTLKERLKLESLLPFSGGDVGAALLDLLKYNIGDTKESTKRQLTQYANHCRYYPSFIKTTL
jgi:hypothetical protein